MTAPLTPEAFVTALGTALGEDGCAPRWQRMGEVPVLVGRRSDFRLRWFATRLHLFTLASVVPVVTRQEIENFTDWAQDYARRNKGGLPRGLQTGTAVFPCLVSARVDPQAQAWAAEKQRTRFACMARPVVVDTSTCVVATFRGRAGLGLVYQAHLLRRAALYFDRTMAATAGPSAGRR